MNASEDWKRVWETKQINVDARDILSSLILANGFDTGCGDYTADQWRNLTAKLAELLGIVKTSKVLEVGCGSGALLHGIQTQTEAEVYGYDYSQSLIGIANEFVKGVFLTSEAIFNPFREIQFDCVISHSVFQYFPSEQYALDTIRGMAAALAPGGRIALLDINDSDSQQMYHDARRANYSSPTEYDEKYRHFPHLFLKKTTVVSILDRLGFKEIEFVPHFVREYKNSTYRFNVVAKRP